MRLYDLRWGRGMAAMLGPALMASVLFGAAPATVSAEGWRGQLVRPSPEFSQMPFWFWNDLLEKVEIKRQLADWREQGVHGFVIHARMGLSREIPYMGPRWLELVRVAVTEAARTGMRVCLYDEGMYPSGSAHGQVVRSNPAFAAQGLVVEHQDVIGPAEIARPAASEGKPVATVVAALGDGGKTIDPATLRLIEDGVESIRLASGAWRVMTFTCVPTGGRIRGVHEGEDDRQPDAPPAADLLNPEAMQTFIRLAYDPYQRTVGDFFGSTVIGMFTDEPDMRGRGARRGLQPWTDGLAAYFEQRRGYALLSRLPALFFDVGEDTLAIREDFRRTLAERLDETYYRPLSEWCERYGIALTGHSAGATEIYPLRYFQIPGQDIVWRSIVPEGNRSLEGNNSALGKCSSSVARHDGRRFNANEVYGAYGWQLTMEEMKWLADWLMVRGVNRLFPHAFYYSIRDDRVHERPPDVGPHNAWWPHYRRFADYTTRLCGLLTDGRQVCEAAILGGNHQLPWRAAKWLFQHQVDFNYVEDWRLIEQARIEDGRLRVGEMSYGLLIVDQDPPLRGAVAERVNELAAAGARIRYCRGEPTAKLVEGIRRDMRADPATTALRYAHIVKNGVRFYLLVNEEDGPIVTNLTVRGRGRPEWFDAWTGTFRPAHILHKDEDTLTVPLELPRRESIVLCIDPAESAVVQDGPPPAWRDGDPVELDGSWTVSRPDGEQIGDALGDWLAWPGFEGYGGTLTYRTRVTLRREAGTRYTLNLGHIGDFAVVRVNGCALPVRFWAPFTWDVTDTLVDGENVLAVEVTNSFVNRYHAEIRRPSGLFGPVKIVPAVHSSGTNADKPH